MMSSEPPSEEYGRVDFFLGEQLLESVWRFD